jgi:hypothetical protein
MDKVFYSEVLKEMPDADKEDLKEFLESTTNQHKLSNLLKRGSLTAECSGFQITFHRIEDIYIVLEILGIEMNTASSHCISK